MECLTSNFTGSKSNAVREDVLHGRDYLVAPVTLIVPGVLNGSQGPLYYPLDEVQRNVDLWNGMPLTLYHPKSEDGSPISARHPTVLEKQQIGSIYNAAVNGKLTAEAWFDVEVTRRLEPRILAALLANQPIEISTGLCTETELANEGAVFNGIPYKAIARNYRPDHLAVLPDEIGACSLEDGCGILANQNSDLYKLGVSLGLITPKPKENHLMAITANEKKSMVDSLINDCTDCGWKETDRETLNALSDQTLTILTNQSKAVNAADAKLAETAPLLNVINEVLGNKTTAEELADRLKGKKTKPEDEEEELDAEGKKKVKNEEKKPQTEKEWFDSAPPTIRAAVQNAMVIESRERQHLIQQLVANAPEDQREAHAKRLAARSVEDLRADVTLLPKVEEKTEPLANYFGAAGGAPTIREDKIDREDFLPLPTINYQEEVG